MTPAFGVVCSRCADKIARTGIEALCFCWASDGPHFHDQPTIPVELDGQVHMLWLCAVCGYLTNSSSAIRAEPFSFERDDPRVIIPHSEVCLVLLPAAAAP